MKAPKKSVDFIQRYIFPGSCIPSNTAMLNSITKMTDLRLTDLEDIGPHYATTLAMWRKNFFANIHQVRKLGYSEEFIKMWESTYVTAKAALKKEPWEMYICYWPNLTIEDQH